jgi:hypothetical protein
MKRTEKKNYAGSENHYLHEVKEKYWYRVGYMMDISFQISFCLPVKEFYGTRYQSGFLFLINVGSGFHCLHSFSFQHYTDVLWQYKKEYAERRQGLKVIGKYIPGAVFGPSLMPLKNGPSNTTQKHP